MAFSVHVGKLLACALSDMAEAFSMDIQKLFGGVKMFDMEFHPVWYREEPGLQIPGSHL